MAISRKIAVFFPGIGYTCDKPLLYYTSKLAKASGFVIRRVSYTDMPDGVKGDKRKMRQAFDCGLKSAETLLSDIEWDKYDCLLFVGKSVGTAIAAAYANKHNLPVKTIAFTPLEETFLFADANTIMFHGTADPWAETDVIRRGCQRLRIPLYLTENANHSLETGDLVSDLENLRIIMQKVDSYITGITPKRVQPLKIRKCVRADMYTVAQLYNENVRYLQEHINYPKWKLNEYPCYESVRLAIDEETQFAAFEEDACVGAFILNRSPQGLFLNGQWSIKADPSEVFVIHTLATDPETFCQGIATEMIEFCIAKAREEGAKAIRLNLLPSNEPARRLIEKLGFVYVGDMDLGTGLKDIPVFSLYEYNI